MLNNDVRFITTENGSIFNNRDIDDLRQDIITFILHDSWSFNLLADKLIDNEQFVDKLLTKIASMPPDTSGQ